MASQGGSQGGVWPNAVRVFRTELVPKDLELVGGSCLRFRCHRAPQVSEPYGRPCATDRRTASTSASVCDQLEPVSRQGDRPGVQAPQGKFAARQTACKAGPGPVLVHVATARTVACAKANGTVAARQEKIDASRRLGTWVPKV